MSTESLADVAQQLKQLSESIINRHLDDSCLNYIGNNLKQLQQYIQSIPDKKRQIAHFDFSKIHTETASVLPFGPVFGPLNAMSHNVKLHINSENKHLIADLHCSRTHEGPPNCVHGGSIAAIYDQLLAFTSIYNQTAGHTVTLNIEYLKATPINTPLQFETWIEEENGRKIVIKGLCKVNNDIVSRAEGLFIEYISNG